MYTHFSTWEDSISHDAVLTVKLKVHRTFTCPETQRIPQHHYIPQNVFKTIPSWRKLKLKHDTRFTHDC